jgi:ferredoxin
MTGAEPLVPAAERPVHPNTGYTPERVVRTVLEGLRNPNVPDAADGLRTAYHLSSPAYRESVGGFDRFDDRLSSALFRPLVGHDHADRGALDVNDEVTRTTQAVVVESDGDEYTYEFTVAKQSGGKYDGCWLVDDIDLLASGRRPGFTHMPTVEFDGQEIKCEPGSRLRNVLLRASGINPHNDATAFANCGGNGICGTCAVEVETMDVGENVSEQSNQEGRRMRFPPLRGSDVPNLRLACQTKVLDDVRVSKHEGLWGQHVEDADEAAAFDPAESEAVQTAEFSDGRVVTVTAGEYDLTG